jgi:POT family proton-dependent oligopeptide transporter
MADSTSPTPYRTTPELTEKMPTGIPFIIGNELAERYSFYGMKGLLTVFMTKYLLDASGAVAPMSETEAIATYHNFTAAVYATPFLGALIADIWFGKYRTILSVSLLYCLGHLALALDETRTGLFIGLTLIAFGAGGIKPCVSAHVGDQFGAQNQPLLERAYSWFYFSINLGAFLSMMIGPLLLHNVGPWLAFGLPGLLMMLATAAFWAGRFRFAHVPPAGKEFAREVFSKHGLSIVLKLAPLVLFIAMFWSLFDQTGSSWVIQGQKLDTTVMGVSLYAEQLQAANPIFVMLLIPLFSYALYPAISKVFPLTPLRKIGIGFFVMVPAFLIPAWLEMQLSAGLKPSIMWQIPAYFALTAAEVMVSITGLELFYTQAPNRMKSFIMSLYMAAVTIGNLFTSLVNKVIQNPDGSSSLTGAGYFLFFAGAMIATAFVFVLYAVFYKEQRFVQGEGVAGAS